MSNSLLQVVHSVPILIIIWNFNIQRSGNIGSFPILIHFLMIVMASVIVSIILSYPLHYSLAYTIFNTALLLATYTLGDKFYERSKHKH